VNNRKRISRPTLPQKRLIIGRKPLIEALQTNNPIEKIYFQQGAIGPEVGLIRKLAKEQHINISQVPDVRLSKMTPHNHQGVVAIAALIPYQNIEDIINQRFDQGINPLIVLLDGVTDIRNLGAIARSAHCFGAHALLIPSSFNAGITEDAVKTSAGALEHIPVCRTPSVETAIDVLKMHGIKIVVTDISGTDSLQTIKTSEPMAIVIGSEDKGVGNYAIKNADYLVKIDMQDDFNSLNASVSAGIVLHHVYSL